MESMDYNFFSNSGPPQFSYINYGADAGLLSNGGDLTTGQSGMDSALDASAFLSGSFDYNFDASLSNTGLTPMPTSASPPAQSLSLLPNNSVDSGIAFDENDISQTRRSSSEEKDNMTPAQYRRKAQNRAAQRAFRERKEKHVRDLEAKLSLLTTTTSSLQSDNERLKLMLQRAQTENEILRATASSSPKNHPPSFVDDPSLLPASRPLNKPSTPQSLTDATTYDASSLANGLLSSSSSTATNKHSLPKDGHLISASATWDLLQSHPLYLSGAVDIGEVCERLKRMAHCDGMGPMFNEEEVRRVIEDVGRSGGDELI